MQFDSSRRGTPRQWLLAVFALIFTLAANGAAAQQSRQLSADRNFSLDVRFTVPHPLTGIDDGNGNLNLPDVLFFDLPNIQINSAVGTHTAYLFNGDTQLGVVTNSLNGDLAPHYYLELGQFQTADSNGYNGPYRQTVIDFSTVLDGTIDGRMLFTVSKGSYEFLTSSIVRGMLGRGFPGGFAGGEIANIVSVKLVALNPPSAFEQLATEVTTVGVGKRFVRPVELALAYYTAGDIESSCLVLSDFVSQVDGLAALKKPKLTFQQASKLNSHAEGLMNGIGCD